MGGLDTLDLQRRQRLYDSIKDCKDDTTRNVLYREFISKFYPEAFEVITLLSSTYFHQFLEQQAKMLPEVVR